MVGGHSNALNRPRATLARLAAVLAFASFGALLYLAHLSSSHAFLQRQQQQQMQQQQHRHFYTKPRSFCSQSLRRTTSFAIPVGRPFGLPRSALDPPMKPVMTPAELFTLQWYASQACTYVEFGSGASTVLAAPLAGVAMSIENHRPFCEQMRARKDVSFWIAQGKLQYECADTGETLPWGVPKNASETSKYRNYVEAIDRFLFPYADNYSSNSSSPRRPSPVVDVVFVDGRARVACAIKTLWNIDDASIVLLHDYIGREPQYARVLEFYNVIDRVDTMVVLARKRKLDWEAAAKLLMQFVQVTQRRRWR